MREKAGQAIVDTISANIDEPEIRKHFMEYAYQKLGAG